MMGLGVVMSEQTPKAPRKAPALPKWFGLAWLIIAGITAAIFNSWASIDGIASNTISAHATAPGRTLFTVAGLFSGALLGHWCSRSLGLPVHPLGPLPVLVIIACVTLIDALMGHWIATRYPFIALAAAGFPLGMLLWAMEETAT